MSLKTPYACAWLFAWFSKSLSDKCPATFIGLGQYNLRSGRRKNHRKSLVELLQFSNCHKNTYEPPRRGDEHPVMNMFIAMIPYCLVVDLPYPSEKSWRDEVSVGMIFHSQLFLESHKKSSKPPTSLHINNSVIDSLIDTWFLLYLSMTMVDSSIFMPQSSTSAVKRSHCSVESIPWIPTKSPVLGQKIH